MHSLLRLLFCTALILSDLASAAPTSAPLIPRSFKVERSQHASSTRHPRKAMMKAYAKWNLVMPASSTPVQHVAAASKNSSSETGQVSNTPSQSDAEFLSPIQIGGQTIMMDFDTGSSDLWVFNTNLPPSMRQGHTAYDPWVSKTWKNLQGSSYRISYGDGSKSEGFVGTDTVNIGGATVTSQAIELPTIVSGSFAKDTSSNGLVGLAFSSLNTVKPNSQLTFFDNVRGSLAQPVFTANLKHNATGFYEFGQIDGSMFQGEIHYTPIQNSGFWQFDSNSFAVGGGQVQQNTQGHPAIADTGTSLLLVDDSVMNGYYSQVQGAAYNEQQGGVTFPCDSNLPSLQIALGDGGYMGTIEAENLVFANLGSNLCFGSMQSNGGGNIQIFGDILFKSQFVVFNNGDNTIGFAPHA